jgi:hypothetical protein
VRLQEFKTWVKRELGEDEGCPSVKVELSDKQIEQALNNAKEWFCAFVGIYKEASLNLVYGQNEYDLSSVTPRIGEVVQAIFPLPASRIDFNTLYPGFLDVNGIPYGMSGVAASGVWGDNSYPQTTVVQTMQTLSSNEKIFSSDLDWEYYDDPTVEPNVRILRVMPAPTQDTGTCIYRYSVLPEDIKIEWFNKKYQYFLKQWALADAKYKLGRKRAKFSSYSTAGGEKQLDGESLIAESREDKQILEDKILDVQGPPMPLLY